MLTNFFALGSPKWDTVLQVWSPKCQTQMNNHFPWTPGYFLAKASSCTVGLVHWAGQLLNGVQLVICQDPQVPSAKLLSIYLAPSLYCCLKLFHPGCKPLLFCFHCSSWDCWQPISPDCPGPSKWQPFLSSLCSSSLVAATNFWKVHSILGSKLSKKTVSNIGSITGPSGMLSVAILHLDF